ncbi:hypothetical protein FBUS_11299 [Fasciolopsis buskii]|uniref:Uncharacterized protein n=1 Tax=Fasciolopsis buskii TaxID=27845 RepID=A0A8E0VKF0_9TREM|nr:hypothetical protein FBUS_11299 [Fasciolopsis buski]
MCELLLFDEAVYDRLSEVNKPAFVFNWLLNLDKILPGSSKQTIRECQEDLVQQLLSQLSRAFGPPTQKLIGRCLANLFLVGDTVLLYTAINTCNSMLKSRDDGACNSNTRLASITCLGTMYKCLGRMIGRSFEDSVSLMVRLIKQVRLFVSLSIHLAFFRSISVTWFGTAIYYVVILGENPPCIRAETYPLSGLYCLRP